LSATVATNGPDGKPAIVECAWRGSDTVFGPVSFEA
jgi:hypothetical protein